MPKKKPTKLKVNTKLLIPQHLNLTCNFTCYNRYKSFLSEWLANGFNGTLAYQAIYPVTRDTPEIAKVNASQLLTNPNVVEILNKEFNLDKYMEKPFILSKTVELHGETKRDDIKMKSVQFLAELGKLTQPQTVVNNTTVIVGKEQDILNKYEVGNGKDNIQPIDTK